MVPRLGRLLEIGDRYEPYRLIDPDGAAVEAIAIYFQELWAAGESAINGSLLRDGSVAVAWTFPGTAFTRDPHEAMHRYGRRML